MTIIFKIFDKTFPNSTGIYGTKRFKDCEWLQTVRSNHDAIRQEMMAENILVINHVYGTRIIDADLITDFSEEPDADAALTTKPGLLLTIQTADCVPVLLFSEEESVIGAAHCSWHTTRDDILMLLVRAMQSKGAKKIRAVLGPAIAQQSYEVDQLFFDNMMASCPEAKDLFIPAKRQAHYRFDMPGFCTLKLKQLGITPINEYCEDTYKHPDKYYSYRRDVHQGICGEKTNILSTIMIETNESGIQ